jgi:hypothetical protein
LRRASCKGPGNLNVCLHGFGIREWVGAIISRLYLPSDGLSPCHWTRIESWVCFDGGTRGVQADCPAMVGDGGMVAFCTLVVFSVGRRCGCLPHNSSMGWACYPNSAPTPHTHPRIRCRQLAAFVTTNDIRLKRLKVLWTFS